MSNKSMIFGSNRKNDGTLPLVEKGHIWKESGYDTGKEVGRSRHSFAK